MLIALTGNTVVDGDGGGRGTSGKAGGGAGGGDGARGAGAGEVGGSTPVAEQPRFPAAAALEMDPGRLPTVSEEALEAWKKTLTSEAGEDMRGAGFQREDPQGAGDIYLFRLPRTDSDGPASDSHMVGSRARVQLRRTSSRRLMPLVCYTCTFPQGVHSTLTVCCTLQNVRRGASRTTATRGRRARRSAVFDAL